MIKILINNNRCRLTGDQSITDELIDLTKIKHPRAFWSTARREGKWDGNIRFITGTGTFDTGMLPKVLQELKEAEVKFQFIDQRETFKDLHEVTELGGLKFRGYQKDAVDSVMNNRLHGIKYPRGILYDATNAGKNLIASGIFASFSKKRRGIFLIDNSVIYEQALEELEKLLPDEIGRFDTRKKIWKRVTICMVQSLASQLKKDPKVKAELAKTDIVIVDECDTVAGRETFKKVRQICFDAPIWIGLSGTPFGKWPKDRLKNREIENVFGPIIHTIRNSELIAQGVSTPPHITFLKGAKRERDGGEGYADTYDRAVIKNKYRNRKVWKRTHRAHEKGRGPVLIIIKNREHINQLLKRIPKELQGIYKIEYCWHKTQGRKQIFERFNEGLTDVLIASMIIKRGLNLKKIRTLINAGAGDSDRNTLQVLGRALRKDVGKEIVYLEDFYDDVDYLRRHSKHRIKAYEDESFPVNKLFLKKTIR